MSDSQFRTFQTVSRYEKSLLRHAQYVRWTRAILCPCLNQRTRMPDPNCTQCYGKGSIYTSPGPQSILQEAIKHDNLGRCYPAYSPFTGTPTITLRGQTLGLGSQPADKSYIQLTSPYPRAYDPVMANYDYNPVISVTDEDSEVVAANTLRVTAPRYSEKGKTFEGSIDSVTNVYNVTRDESYTVTNFAKEYIYLEDMGTWQSGDVLEVDYAYIEPFAFMLIQVSMKMRWERAYVLEQADAVLITPYWAKITTNDLFTTLASDQFGSAVIDPTLRVGNDEISNFYDLSKLIEVVDMSGTRYSVGVGNDVEMFGRNEIKWNVTKPTNNYTVTFHYHPTYVSLQSIPTLRTSENKSFVNRVSVQLRDKIDSRDF